MKYPNLMQTAALAAVFAAGGAAAQTSAQTTAPSAVDPPAVVSDVGPTPAQERNSIGAIVLEDSMVRAQRDRSFEKSSARTGVESVGRRALRSTMKEQTKAELARAREAEAVELYRRGAAGQTEN